MQREPSRQRGGNGVPPHLSTFEAPLEDEEAILEAMLTAYARGQLSPDAWENLHQAAVRDERLSELAFAYESVSQGNRLRTLPGAVAAEFLFRAGTFFADVFADEYGAMAYLERALASVPSHAPSFEKLDALLTKTNEWKRLAQLSLDASQHRARGEQAPLMRRAAELFDKAGGHEEKVIEIYQQLLRLDPSDEQARGQLEARYTRANRLRDVARLLEQALTADPPPQGRAAKKLHTRLLDLYANQLHEPERTIPHVEALLEDDPSHDDARRVASKLIVIKGLAARSAAALARAHEAVGAPAEVARFLQIELEHTRGPKRRDVLKRIGVLKQARLNDPAGAFESFEQAMQLDATDDDLRQRYAEVASKLGRPLDAAKVLGRAIAGTKEPSLRARLSAEMGRLLFDGGDVRRAKTTFVAVLSTPDAGAEASLDAARGLRDVFAHENDERGLLDALARLAEVETDPERACEVNEQLAELATRSGDTARAMTAYRRLIDTRSRAVALAALEPLLEASGDAAGLAAVLEERSRDTTDHLEARRLAFRGAEVLTERGEDPAAASSAWRRFVERFGNARDAHGQWIPLLEAQRDWPELARVLEMETEIAPPDERAAILSHLGLLLLQRLRQAPNAIQAFARALTLDPSEKTSRATLEKLAALGEHRLSAALALEPIYRGEGDSAAVLRVLEVRALFAATPEDRLTALEEAVEIAGGGNSDHAHALELAGRGLAEAASGGTKLTPWLDRIERLAATGAGADPRRRASIFSKALGDREVESPELATLARATGEAHAASGNIPAALDAFRRALHFEPSSAELLARVDDLLREQGSPEERIAIYSAALRRGEGGQRRKELLHRIGSIQRNDLRDTGGAVVTYRTALAEDPNDGDAYDALFELYSERSQWRDLATLLEGRLPRVVGDDARRTRAQLAEVAAANGDAVRAKEQCTVLLGDPALGPDELLVVERVAELLDDVDVARYALRRRADAAEDPSEQVTWLERLGRLESERRGDFEAAAEAWKQAARLAESAGDDDTARALYARVRKTAPDDYEAALRLAELCERAGDWVAVPSLYAVLLDHAPDVERRAALLLRIARVFADRLNDTAEATEHAGRAFELAPHDPEVLAAFERYAVRAGAVPTFQRAAEEALARQSLPPPRRFDLLMATGRVSAADPTRGDDASALYRALLEDDTLTPAQHATTGTAFEALLALSDETNPARKADRRWLLQWRVSHASEAEAVPALLAWASAEETSFDDLQQALTLHRRVLALDPEHDESITAAARLALKLGDAGAALDALVARRDRSEGPARQSLDLEIATLLMDHTTRFDEALSHVASVLEATPNDPNALALAARLLGEPDARTRAMALLDGTYESVEDPAARIEILKRLLDVPAVDAAAQDARRRWYERLLELQEAAGELEAALAFAVRAAGELPSVDVLWERAETIARALRRPDEVANLYVEVFARPIDREAALVLGERAVAFYEEWFEDPARVVGILGRVLEIDPCADWAFDRLKLLFNAAERWDDLFALFDRVLPAVDETRRRELLEEAAQTAKDFAAQPERAVGYLEELHTLSPDDAALSASLERLYERLRRHRALVGLLGERLARLPASEAQKTRGRIASLWIDDLGDPTAALAVVEQMLSAEAEVPPAPASVSERPDTCSLLERILAVTAPSSDPSSVRQRVAALLKVRYLGDGHERELVRVLTIELEAVSDTDGRVALHERIADLQTTLGDDAAALEQRVALVMLEPGVAEHRERLAALSDRMGDLARYADVLSTAADACDDETLRVELLMQSAVAWDDRVGDPARAVELFLRVLGTQSAAASVLLDAARRADPLLETARRDADRLRVLEQTASLEPDAKTRRAVLGRAAQLATALGEDARAIDAWQKRIDDDDGDLEALDGLDALLEKAQSFEPLIAVLTRRARAAVPAEQRRVDLTRVARIYGNELGRTSDAIRVWRDVEGEFGESDESITALAKLLEHEGRWEELASLLERAAARAPNAEGRASFLARLGDVQKVQLADLDRAVRAYRAALESHREDAIARAGLHSLLADERQRAAAVEALLETYTATDEWRAVLDLTNDRLRAAQDGPNRLKVLLHAANLAEGRAQDRSIAFEAIRHAFLLDPENSFVGAELRRLAEATSGWPRFVAVHRAAITAREQDVTAAPLVARMRFDMAEVLEVHVKDFEQALDACLRIPVDAPNALDAAHAAVRVGGKIARWDAVAQVFVRTVKRTLDAAPSLYASMENASVTASDWDALTQTVTDEVAKVPLPAILARDVEARIAVWHRDRRGDNDAAEAALHRALAHDATNVDLLAALVDLQRRAKGRPLVESLLRLSEITGGDPVLLREAAEVAYAPVGDRTLAREILERLYTRATEMWSEAGDDDRSGTYASLVRWAIAELQRVHTEEGAHAQVVDLLVEAAKLPFEPEDARALRYEAANVATTKLGDDERAIGLYAGLFEEEPHDTRAVDQLVVLYTRLEQTRDLLALRERQIETAQGVEPRVGFRLEAARLLVTESEGARAVGVLRENLRELPRDPRTVAALVELLEQLARHADLGDLFAEQAHLASETGDAVAAAELWARAATIAEESLGDADTAIVRHEHVVALEPRAASLAALARLHTAREDHATAAGYLEKLHQAVGPTDRVDVTLRLADALVASGRADAAQIRLEEGMAADPASEGLRARLAGLYREKKAWPELAHLLTVAAAHAPDKAARLERLSEAAGLLRGPCNDPTRAIPLLEQAVDLEPGDQAVRLALADALGAAERFDEARTLLRALIDGFGGRRPKERAPVHFHLARLELAMGDRARALVELDAATRIDPANPRILRTLAELARDDGQLERAERSYRALLVVLRRQDETRDDAIARSEVLLELSAIASRQGDEVRANEIFESALEAAARGPFEEDRLEQALRAKGAHPLRVRALEARVARTADPARLAPALSELAEVLAEVGRPDDALLVCLRALALDPVSDALHASSLALAKASGAAQLHAETLTSLVDDATRRNDNGLAVALLLRLGGANEGEDGGDARAAQVYERALALDVRVPDVLRALDRVYGRLGSTVSQVAVLTRLVALESDDPHGASDAYYRLATLQLSSRETMDEGCASLERALALEADLERAEAALHGAAEQDPRHEQVLELYEYVGRHAGRERALVHALSLRADLPNATSETLREAVELALRLEDNALAERLLVRFVDGERRARPEGGHLVWALCQLADLRQAAGDVRQAADLKSTAAAAADPEAARALYFEVARLAADALDDLPLAAKTYEALRESDPADREVWGPLLDVYRRTNDGERLAILLADVIDMVDDPAERSRLRLERVQVMMRTPGLADEAAERLRELVDDDPTQVEAAFMLATLLDEAGRDDELAALLARQMDTAKDRNDAQSVASLALRLGRLLEKTDPVGARNVYYAGLDWEPAHRELLQALLRIHETHGDIADRADVMERLLGLERGPESERLALALHALRIEQWDDAAAERALEMGYRAYPSSVNLRERLEAAHRERREWAKLAALCMVDARTRAEVSERVARLREAAAIYRAELGDPRAAAAVLKGAYDEAPQDVALLTELVAMLTDANEHATAGAELTRALEHWTAGDVQRAMLLANRAAVRSELGDHDGALVDLEEAFSIDPGPYARPLATQLEQSCDAAHRANDATLERQLKLRLVEVLQKIGDTDGARSLLADMIRLDPRDRETLRRLARIEEAAGRWDGASSAYRRLVALEDDPALVIATALRLATACERAGRVADARGGLERARMAAPDDPTLRRRLEQLYEETGAWRELALLALEDARATGDVAGRFGHLMRAGTLLLENGDAEGAIAPLRDAHALRTSDADCIALLADACLATGFVNQASELLDDAITMHKGRRSKELAALYHRRARVAQAGGDLEQQIRLLAQALDVDSQSGVVASELAELALESGQLDLANRALRAVTMLKVPGPMSRARAYQCMGEIARRQGDVRKAVVLLKRAISEDAGLADARTLLDALQQE